MDLSQTVRRIARRLPHYPAITSDSGTISYRELDLNIGRIAGGLRGRLGLTPGARVGIAMENCPEFFEVLYGIWRSGLAAADQCEAAREGNCVHPRECRLQGVLLHSEIAGRLERCRR